MLIRIGPDSTVVGGDSEYGTPIAIWEILHNSKFDDADADSILYKQPELGTQEPVTTKTARGRDPRTRYDIICSLVTRRPAELRQSSSQRETANAGTLWVILCIWEEAITCIMSCDWKMKGIPTIGSSSIKVPEQRKQGFKLWNY
jgi:hypothetical protein